MTPEQVEEASNLLIDREDLADRLAEIRSAKRVRIELAAAYVDEKSVDAFRRRVGDVYPASITISGRGEVWRREDLDQAIDKLGGRAPLTDLADVLL